MRQLRSGQWAGSEFRCPEPPWPRPPGGQAAVLSWAPRAPQPEKRFPPWDIHKALRIQVTRNSTLCEDDTHIPFLPTSHLLQAPSRGLPSAPALSI